MAMPQYRPSAQGDGDPGDQEDTRIVIVDDVVYLDVWCDGLADTSLTTSAVPIGARDTVDASLEDALRELLARVHDLERLREARRRSA